MLGCEEVIMTRNIEFTDGVTGNGVTAGPLTFSVPSTAPSLLYYQCSAHGPMVGEIHIFDVAPVPASSPTGLALLALGLLGAGGGLAYASLRARARQPAA
jgi:hypothetical protein